MPQQFAAAGPQKRTFTERAGALALTLLRKPQLPCHNNAVFQDSVLHDFHDWCRTESLSLLDLMTSTEFTWYDLLLVKHCPEWLVRSLSSR